MLPNRNDVTLRFLRHFLTVYVPTFENESLERIFGMIVEWILLNLQNVSKALTTITKQLVQPTIELYSRITSELLPTPAKSHYTYNLRDMSKVFQGIS